MRICNENAGIGFTMAYTIAGLKKKGTLMRTYIRHLPVRLSARRHPKYTQFGKTLDKHTLIHAHDKISGSCKIKFLHSGVAVEDVTLTPK